MHAIKIPQPQAHCIVVHGHGSTVVDFPITHLGPVLIHAAATRRFAANVTVLDLNPREIVYGAFVALADISGCDKSVLGGWFVSLANVRPIEPIPHSERRKWFHVHDEIVRNVSLLSVAEN